jgi:hypothetical protein
MKTAIINTKDWNIADCMSAVRFVEYTSDDFKNVSMISTGGVTVAHGDLRHKCRHITGCTVGKCNLKKGLLENKQLILDTIKKTKLEEAIKTIEILENKINGIVKTIK